MSTDIQTIRDDLAFMRAVASDQGRLPGIVGAHFLAAGLIFGLPVLVVWATLRGLVDLPTDWTSWVGLICTGVYLPVLGLLIWLGPKSLPQGAATGRAFLLAWSGLGLTTLATLFVIFTAGAKLHVQLMWQVWTAACFVLYGAAWWAVAFLRPRRGWMLVAIGSYLTAMVNALLIGSPDVLLGCAIGILLWLAGPGLMIMLRAPRQG